MKTEELITMSLPYNESRNKTVRVYVPAHEEGETLPVIYMTDGQNVFDDENVMFGCWYTREAVREEAEKTGKSVIIVGIHNDEGAMERASELTPKSIGRMNPLPPDIPDEQAAMMKPAGEEFDDFVINVVMPAVEEKFPVKKGRENTAFCGSSSGGLVSFYITLSHSDKFSAAGVFSLVPLYIVYDHDDVNNWIRSKIKGNMPYMYMFSGSAEGMEQEICTNMEMTYEFMKDLYPSEKIKKVISPDAPHHESAWQGAFKDFLHIFLNSIGN